MREHKNNCLVQYDKDKSRLMLLGMSLVEIELPPESSKKMSTRKGVSVLVINPGSESYRGGVRNGDIVAEVDNVRIKSLKMLRSVLAHHDPHDPIFMFLLTGGIWRFVNLSFITGNV